MASCPYTTHQGRFDVPPSFQPVASCREGCQRTFFFCPRCQEANRPLARYCRQCGEEVSFAEAQAQQDSVRPLQEGRDDSYKLNGPDVGEVQSLKNYRGLLIVVTDKSVLLYDLHKLHEPLYHFRPPDGRVVRGVTMVGTQDDEQLLITTSRSIYRLSLLTMQPESAPVYELSDQMCYITHPVVECAGQLYVLELDERKQSSRLVRLPDQSVHTFDGTCRSALKLSAEKFFFCTRDYVFLFDGAEGRVEQQRFPEQLAEADVAYGQESETLYLVGESGLWRLSIGGNATLTPTSLPTSLLGTPCLAAHGDSVFVAHAQGFLVLDPFGTVRWNSAQQFINAASDGLRPQLTAEHVLFTSLGRSGGSDLRIHVRNELNNFKTLVFEQRLLCPPLLIIGRILSASGDTSAVYLNCRM